ncbi:carbohydrate kinase family protein [Stygiolobus caldivivus]|uniref:Sugar kinase n=1 Tax=Stygiolobus caldivivus TaxID=2824673 RepID=A0A8D5U589_9CREN|nr:carbohydrate kinase family protein [Stygiolobus caldivivus]BCU69513.1 sugar kinase [Stygiolobus caldivivus]
MKPIHLSVGKINIDILVKLDHFPEPDEPLTTETMDIQPGGAAVNYAIAVNKLGHSVKILAKVGKDSPVVRPILEKIAETGVGLDYVEEVNAPQSMALVLLRDNGKVSIVRKLGSSLLLSSEDVKKYFGLFDVIHFASVPPEIVVRDPNSELVTYDPGPNSSKLDSSVNVDILYLNEKESKAVNINKLRGVNIIVIKMGDRGARVISHDSECEAEAYRVKDVVDTTGAGDVFDAAFNYGYMEGHSIEESLKLAIISSALKVTRLGGTSSPTLSEVLNALKSYNSSVYCK